MLYKIFFLIIININLIAIEIFDIKHSNEDILSSLKQYNLKKNFTSLDDNISKDYIPKNTNLNNLLDTQEKNLFKDTAYLQVFLLGTVGFLYMLPPSITKWEDEDTNQTIWDKWIEHVKAGPVWDKDDFAINYIGHPISGAWYYMVAREDGFSPFESFFYSFCMSTFFWEYGYEAFAEIPSIQDLIFTPGIGAFVGEYFWYLQNNLDKNHGILFGSKTLGNIGYFLLNPIKRITESMDKTFHINTTFYYQVFQPHIMIDTNPILQQIDYIPNSYGFTLKITF